MSNEDILVSQDRLAEISLINCLLVRSLNQTAIERIWIGYLLDISDMRFAYLLGVFLALPSVYLAQQVTC